VASAITTAGLIDTYILIDAQHLIGPAVAFMTAQQALGQVHLSIISAMELVAGCRNAGDLATVRSFLSALAVLPISPIVSQDAYDLMESFFLSHGLAIADAIIAATALRHGLTLYTRNVRHFQMIPGLTVVRPY